MGYFLGMAKRRGPKGPTIAGQQALAMLREGIKPSIVARHLGVTRQAVHYYAVMLRRKGRHRG